MKIYIVRNDEYICDYFVEKINAEKEMERVNKLCYEFKNDPKVNSNPVFIDEIETADCSEDKVRDRYKRGLEEICKMYKDTNKPVLDNWGMIALAKYVLDLTNDY